MILKTRLLRREELLLALVLLIIKQAQNTNLIKQFRDSRLDAIYDSSKNPIELKNPS